MKLELFKIREILGPIYGSETTSMLLYTLVKYSQPEVVLELGTGMGISTLLIAQALKENGRGIVITLDDDSHQRDLFENIDRVEGLAELDFLNNGKTLEESLSLENMARRLGLEDYIRIVKTKIQFDGQILNVTDEWQLPIQKIDMVFSDFAHGPEECQKILLGLLPFLNFESEVLIDSASSYLSSLYAVEKLIGNLNCGKIPRVVQMIKNENFRSKVIQTCQGRAFNLSHFFQKGRDQQNSTLRINISLPDYLPTLNTRVIV